MALTAENMRLQAGRRRVQRRFMTWLLCCSLVVVVFYALLVICTGIYVVYNHFASGQPIYSFYHVEEQVSMQDDPALALLAESDVRTPDEQSRPNVNSNANKPFEVGARRLLRMRRLMRGDVVLRRKRAIPTDRVGDIDEGRPTYNNNKNTHVNQTNCSNSAPSLSDSEDGLFPDDLFTPQQRRNGAILLHLCGLCYMFVALAIVCDEFFVPSLGVITEELQISDDVAGATFMAAGGSAPEFFTSLFGIFITENNVGVGTIVGSATFNILFVLAFCCIFSKEVLHLTWWPLFRDMTFYVIALMCLLVFFYDEQVSMPEATVLFITYIAYGFFMKYNAELERWTKAYLGLNGNTVAPVTQMVESAMSNGMSNVKNAVPILSPRTERAIPVLHSGAMFRTGFMQMALDRAEVASDTSSLPGTFSPREPPPPKRVTRAKSQPAIMVPKIHGLKRSDALQNQRSPQSPDTERASAISTSSVWSSATPVLANGNGHISPTVLPATQVGVESDVESPVDISWPDTFHKRCVYISLAPILLPLYFTLADVKKPGNKRYVVWTFVGAILWIAIYSYLMVWWANVIGSTIGIPSEIMGLTILAAGTSIPDLITSILVARKGLGDMAVSSSIGSNLFDVCVGLPLPWLINFFFKFLFHGTYQPIPVISNGLICSVSMLFSMLLVLCGSVAMFKWRMSHTFGATMLVAYTLFCVLSVLLELDWLSCPLRRAGLRC